MPHLLIEHTVADYEEWKSYFDDHARTRAESGCEGAQLFHKEGEPDEILILFEWDSFDNLHEFAASDDLRETMDKAGVIGDFHLLEKIEDVPV